MTETVGGGFTIGVLDLQEGRDSQPTLPVVIAVVPTTGLVLKPFFTQVLSMF